MPRTFRYCTDCKEPFVGGDPPRVFGTKRLCDDCFDLRIHPITCQVREREGDYLGELERLEDSHTALLEDVEALLGALGVDLACTGVSGPIADLIVSANNARALSK